MEPEDTYNFETAEQFWQKLEETVSQTCGKDEHETIDNALRSYIALTTGFPDYVESERDLRRCAYKLYSSVLFAQHADYIRTQLVHCLLQEDESNILYITATFLLADAREHESTFELLNNEGAFQTMVHLIRTPRADGEEGLHRLLMELLYEMSRIQKIKDDDLVSVDDDFICCLFNIIEEVSNNVADPYHYPVIRVLLVLSEQYMVAEHNPATKQHKTVPFTNKVIKVLSSHGREYKTFGGNIILLLNREDETSLQLLTLKLLYLLFTTPSTCEYFYTNDLHVLVDILVRNLLDLPEEATALRHTYLRVLHPLLERTQLRNPPHYKRDEIRKVLVVMSGGRIEEADENIVRYFEDVDETTKRLVRRCQTVSWLKEPDVDILEVESPTDVTPAIIVSPDSHTKATKEPPALPAPRKLKKRNSSKESDTSTGPYLNPQMEARQSSLSMMEMAAQKEKPGVKTPSRNPSMKHGLRGLVMQKKEKPPPPKARRSAWRKDRTGELTVGEIANATVDSASEMSHDENAQDSTGEDLHISKARSVEVKAEAKEEAKPKKPPPAPKARRWRGRRTKEDESNSKLREPGKFTVDLPSINTDTDQGFQESPFSPPADKTLSPEVDIESSKKSKRISSVSMALNQAQMHAIQNIEESFEKVHLDVTHEHQQESPSVERDSPPLQRAVLAPPGQAPMRGVPGPKMELGKSPFLSDDESEAQVHGKVGLTSVEERSERESDESLKVEILESSEDEWND